MPSLRRLRTAVTVDDLHATIVRYLGAKRTEHSFQTFEASEGRKVLRFAPADVATIRFAGQLLASAVGFSSARLILCLLFQRNDQSSRNAFRLLDYASESLQHNRDLLQTRQWQAGLLLSRPETADDRQRPQISDLPSVCPAQCLNRRRDSAGCAITTRQLSEIFSCCDYSFKFAHGCAVVTQSLAVVPLTTPQSTHCPEPAVAISIKLPASYAQTKQ